ncbi:hypothetical protein cyc_01025 [Cyclospora cayetanensis]|uniref:Uncharacterized protein n=1 Tax=Cyclospora cayetanensis TaxID=88456 RepID=A0A1D3CWH7_9EIME|nr:hypothetical protein cyc_01025 [Cyclospora cayetanensis]
MSFLTAVPRGPPWNSLLRKTTRWSFPRQVRDTSNNAAALQTRRDTAEAATQPPAGGAAHAEKNEAAGGLYVATMTPFALTRGILKAARSNQRDLLLWKAFARRATALADVIPGEDMARLLSAFGANGLRPATVHTPRADAAVAERDCTEGYEHDSQPVGALDPKGLALAANSLVRLKAMCLVAAALTKHYRQQQRLPQQQSGESLTQEELFKILDKIGERAGQLSSQLTPLAVCCLVDSFASVRFRCGPLLFHVPRHVAWCCQKEVAVIAADATPGGNTESETVHKRVSDTEEATSAVGEGLEPYSVCQLAILLRAFRRLGASACALLPYAFASLPPLPHDQSESGPHEATDALLNVGTLSTDAATKGSDREAAALASVTKAAGVKASPRAPQPLPHSLIWILESAAAESFLDRQGLSLLYRHLAVRADELPPYAFVAVWDCASRLGICTSELQLALQQQMQVPRRGLCFTQKQLQRMHQAFLDLGLSPWSFGVARTSCATDTLHPPSSQGDI